MEKLLIAETPKTPLVILDFDRGVIEMKGRSIPENSFTFYQPLNDALDEYSKSPKPETNAIFNLEYFSTSSSKCILDVFRKLEGIHKNGSAVTVTWFYEERDETMREAGVDYESIIDLPFKLVQSEG